MLRLARAWLWGTAWHCGLGSGHRDIIGLEAGSIIVERRSKYYRDFPM